MVSIPKAISTIVSAETLNALCLGTLDPWSLLGLSMKSRPLLCQRTQLLVAQLLVARKVFQKATVLPTDMRPASNVA